VRHDHGQYDDHRESENDDVVAPLFAMRLLLLLRLGRY
jgi:hypothetical protein